MVAASLIWGAAGPVIKYTLIYVPPFTFLFLRFLCASLIVLPFLILEERKDPISKRDWINLIILSMLGGTFSIGLIFVGFKYTTALEGSLIGAAYPLVALVASAKLLKERITPNEKRGAIIAMLGTLLVIFEPLFNGMGDKFEFKGLPQLFGNLLIGVSLLTATAHAIWSKKILDHIPSKLSNLLHFFHLNSQTRTYSPFFLMGMMSLVSLISFAPLSFMEIAYIKGIRTPTVDIVQREVGNVYKIPQVSSELIRPIAGVLYMAIFSTVVAYFLYEWALKEIPVAETSLYAFLQTVFTIPFAYILLGEKITVWFVVGALIIGYGVYLSEKQTS